MSQGQGQQGQEQPARGPSRLPAKLLSLRLICLERF